MKKLAVVIVVLALITLVGMGIGAIGLTVLEKNSTSIPTDKDTVEMRQQREIKDGDVLEISPIQDAWKWELIGLTSKSNLKFGYQVTIEDDYEVAINNDLSFVVKHGEKIKFQSSMIYQDRAFVLVIGKKNTYKVYESGDIVQVLKGAFCGEPQYEIIQHPTLGAVRMHEPGCGSFDPVSAQSHGYWLLGWDYIKVAVIDGKTWFSYNNGTSMFLLEEPPALLTTRITLAKATGAPLEARFETVRKIYMINNGQTTVDEIDYHIPTIMWAGDQIIYRAPEK